MFLPASNSILLYASAAPQLRYVVNYDTFEVTHTPNITVASFGEVGVVPGTDLYYARSSSTLKYYSQFTHTEVATSVTMPSVQSHIAFDSTGTFCAWLGDPDAVGANVVQLINVTTNTMVTVTNVSGKTVPYLRGKLAWLETQKKFVVAARGRQSATQLAGFFLLDPYTATVDFVGAPDVRDAYYFIACPDILYEVYGAVRDADNLPARKLVTVTTNARYANTATNGGYNPLARYSDETTGVYRVFTPNDDPVSVVAFDDSDPLLAPLFYSHETPSRRRLANMVATEAGDDGFAATAEVEV
jgi:hypothetical protein